MSALTCFTHIIKTPAMQIDASARQGCLTSLFPLLQRVAFFQRCKHSKLPSSHSSSTCNSKSLIYCNSAGMQQIPPPTAPHEALFWAAGKEERRACRAPTPLGWVEGEAAWPGAVAANVLWLVVPSMAAAASEPTSRHSSPPRPVWTHGFGGVSSNSACNLFLQPFQ